MKRLSIERKNKLLLAGFFAWLWVIGVFAIQPTAALREEALRLEARLDSSADAPAHLRDLKTELKMLENELDENNNSSIHEQLLDLLTKYCSENDLVLRDFSSPVIYRMQEALVETHPVKVEGTYSGLLKLVHYLEKTNKGKVVSVDFLSKRDPKTQTLSLVAAIYIQDMIKQ